MFYPSIFNDSFTNDLFDEMVNFPFDYGKRIRNDILDKKRCTTDIKEYDNRYELDLELPGFAKEDIKAELKNGYLVVSAEHTETKEMSENTASKAPEGEEKEAEAKEAEAKEAEVVDEPKYVVRERFYGRFERSFYVGKDIAKDDIKAAFSNGLLTLTVPKSVKKPEPEQEYISITD